MRRRNDGFVQDILMEDYFVIVKCDKCGYEQEIIKDDQFQSMCVYCKFSIN